jgi:hypothetical protein
MILNKHLILRIQKNSGIPEKRASKPAQGKNSEVLQTIQTYQTFTDSLSESEREKFLEFGLKKAAELPKPPALPKKWIERNWQELREEFKKPLTPTPSVDPTVLEREEQEQRSAVLQELAELQKRQQECKQQLQRAKQ